MRAKVLILRELGALHVPIGISRKLRGDLILAHEKVPGEERTVPVLRILGIKDRALFDPRVVSIGSGTIKFAGLERVDRAWYAQEWSCDVFY